MVERIRLSLIFVALIWLYSGHALSAQLLPNGGFEKGNLEHWEDQSFGQASVEIVQRDTCFSQQDTREIQIRGQYAARLSGQANRASPQSGISFAALRSSAFLAGDGFAFIALRGALKGSQNSRSNSTAIEPALALQLDILDAQTDSVLVSQSFVPSAVLLAEGCPSTPVPGHFSSHYFDTRSFSGQAIRIQIKQVVDSTTSHRFTLIDQLVLFQSGEQTLFFSRPYAQAGISTTSSGIPYLDSRGSFDPDRQPLEMRYSWWLKDQHYDLATPCLINVPLGSHQAVLYVNDGQHAISDSLQFYLHTTVAQANLSSDLQCDQRMRPAPAPNSEKVQQLTRLEMAEQAKKINGVPAEQSNIAATGSSPVIESKPLVETIGKPAKIKASEKAQAKAKEKALIDPATEVRKALLSWANTWSNRDAEKHIKAYRNGYTSTEQTAKDWAAGRRWSFKTKKYIKVTLSNIKITAEGKNYKAKFKQSYESNTYKDVVNKVLIFTEEAGRWKITEEHSL